MPRAIAMNVLQLTIISGSDNATLILGDGCWSSPFRAQSAMVVTMNFLIFFGALKNKIGYLSLFSVHQRATKKVESVKNINIAIQKQGDWIRVTLSLVVIFHLCELMCLFKNDTYWPLLELIKFCSPTAWISGLFIFVDKGLKIIPVNISIQIHLAFASWHFWNNIKI